DFALERYFARWEFAAHHLVSASDCEPLTVRELLAIAGTSADVLGDLRLAYAESAGGPALRARIAAMYPGLGTDDILVCGAPEEAIYLAMTTLLGPGDRVVVQVPCYQSLLEIAEHRGADVARWPLVETERGWRADLDQLAALMVPGTKLVIMNTPHNPTGWLATARLVDDRGAYLFADEMYAGLERPAGARLPPAATLSARAISLWGMSKSFALPGLRIGWLATRDRDVRDAALRYKDYTTICAS